MKNKNAQALGKLGGEATKATQPRGFYQRISKLGVEAKRRKKDKSR